MAWNIRSLFTQRYLPVAYPRNKVLKTKVSCLFLWLIMILLIIILITIVIIIIVAKLVDNRKEKEQQCLSLIRKSALILDGFYDYKRYIPDAEFNDFIEQYSQAYEYARKIRKKYPSVICLINKFYQIDKIRKDNHDKNILWVEASSKIPSIDCMLSKYRNSSVYLSNYVKNDIHNRYEDLYLKLRINDFSFFEEPLLTQCSRFVSDYHELNAFKDQNNKTYIEKFKKNYMTFFDTCLSYPLSEEQRTAILTDEDNCLVISAAGSGKTTLIEGKVRYLIEKKKVPPQRILLLTYTRKAAENLTDRINTTGLVSRTFNSYALSIIGECTGSKPTIANEEDIHERTMREMMNDADFKSALVHYYFVDSNPVFSEHECNAQSIKEYIKAKRTEPRQALLPDMDGNLVITKSGEERYICDFLSMNGIAYRYEHEYEYDVSDKYHRQWKPDFTIYYEVDGVERCLYLEHFGVDRNNSVSRLYGDGTIDGWKRENEKYLSGMNWKRRISKQYGTPLIETFSYYFQEHTIDQSIIDQLITYGVPIKRLSDDEILDRIQKNKKQSGVITTMITSFIALMKGQCKTIDEVIKIVEEEGNESNAHEKEIKELRERDLRLLKGVIKPYFLKYQQILSENNSYDFSDTIQYAINCCKQNPKERFDYIIVDEFQDTSIDKYRFIQAIRGDCSKTKLLCVGDDWQSIFRFAGSDMALFTDFKDYFGYTKELRMGTTFRFGEPLIYMSSTFIQQNPAQKKKQVTSFLQSRTEWEFVACKKVEIVLASILQTIPGDKDVLILGRYGMDVDFLNKKNGITVKQKDNNAIVSFAGKNYRFLTVHKAKGLEADYVILINGNSGNYGFPSTIADDHVLSHVLSHSDQFQFGEERRLFYVALTRCKQKVWVLYNENRPSAFVEEILMPGLTDEELCPVCKQGKKVLKWEGEYDNGTKYKKYACTNWMYGCHYSEIIYEPVIRRKQLSLFNNEIIEGEDDEDLNIKCDTESSGDKKDVIDEERIVSINELKDKEFGEVKPSNNMTRPAYYYYQEAGRIRSTFQYGYKFYTDQGKSREWIVDNKDEVKRKNKELVEEKYGKID